MQAQGDNGGAEEARRGSGTLLPEEPAAGEQLREEPAVEEPSSGATDGLSRRSASMWTTDEKSSFLNCFKVWPYPEILCLVQTPYVISLEACKRVSSHFCTIALNASIAKRLAKKLFLRSKNFWLDLCCLKHPTRCL